MIKPTNFNEDINSYNLYLIEILYLVVNHVKYSVSKNDVRG